MSFWVRTLHCMVPTYMVSVTGVLQNPFTASNTTCGWWGWASHLKTDYVMIGTLAMRPELMGTNCGPLAVGPTEPACGY